MSNNLLNDTLVYNGKLSEETKISLITYDKETLKRFEGHRIEDLRDKIDSSKINWFFVRGLEDTAAIKGLCEYFKINFLLAQDVLNTKHTPKIEEYKEYNVIIMKLFDKTSDKGKLVTNQISIIQGRYFVITFAEKDNEIFKGIAHAIGKNILGAREKTSDYLLCMQINSIIGNYSALTYKLDRLLDDIEDRLMDLKIEDKIGQELHAIRRQYMLLRKAVAPIKEQYGKVLQSESSLYNAANRMYFNDINDHMRLLSQDLDICRETLSSLLDLYLSNNEIYMNSIMKKLTIVSTIFIPLTFLAGIWGMNFANMPELSWQFGYLFAWGLLIIIGVAIYVYFKLKKWF